MQNSQTERDQLLDRLVNVGTAMRRAQKEFFTEGRSPAKLQQSKQLEKDFDKLLAQLRDVDLQPRLF